MITILYFLPEIEKTYLQQLSKWWYQIGVGRVQVRARLHRLTHYQLYYVLLYNKKTVFSYCPKLKQIKSHEAESCFPLGFNFVQTVNNRLFVCGGMG